MHGLHTAMHAWQASHANVTPPHRPGHRRNVSADCPDIASYQLATTSFSGLTVMYQSAALHLHV